jgi:hypothetical protein
VRWAIGVIDVLRRMSTTRSWVRSRVDPPAPYVTDTYEGPRGSSSISACRNVSSAFSVRGGKNSNEKLRPRLRMSLIFVI